MGNPTIHSNNRTASRNTRSSSNLTVNHNTRHSSQPMVSHNIRNNYSMASHSIHKDKGDINPSQWSVNSQ
jgi:hypothetical protein